MVATPLASRHRHITHARARCISLAVHQSRWAQARDGMSEPASGHGHFRLISATRAPKRAEVNAHLAVHTIGLAGSHQYAARSTCACGTPPSFARGTRRAAHLALKLRLVRSIFRSLLTETVDSTRLDSTRLSTQACLFGETATRVGGFCQGAVLMC